jgi:hypothetical protein
MRTLYIILLLTTSSLLTSCGSVKGQAYVDVNENIDFENGEDLRYRTRFKVGYKIYLGEKHNILKDKRKKKEITWKIKKLKRKL